MKRNIVIAILLILFLMPLLVIAPEVFSGKKKYIRNGKEYGVTRGLFRGRWWNYYERGHSFAEGEFWIEAEHDLEKAIKKRSKDNLRARTYGLHFVEYFPHRELGTVYHNQGRYEDAEAELMLSLSQQESAKAKFYLNKVRKSIINRDKSDQSAPEISITTPNESTIVSSLDVIVAGTSTDDKYVSEVVINGKPVFIETADKEINFSRKVKLKPGHNTIIVTATDLAGKVAFKKIPITVDRQAPLLSIESIERHTQNSYTINGVVTDETGVSELIMNGKNILVSDKEAEFSHTVSGSEGDEIVFKITDSTGNTTEGTIVLEAMSFAQTDSIKTAFGRQDVPVRYVSLMDSNLIDIMFTDHRCLASKSTAEDKTPPFIKFKKGIKEKQEVFFDSFFIEGKVKDAGGVASLTINDEPIIIRSGVMLHFNYLPELKEGTNEFVVIATDTAGNSSKKIIVVERKIPASHQISARLATAVLPFQKKGDGNTFASIVSDSFLDALSNKNRFNIVARGYDLDAILAELKLSTSDLADKSKALKVGKIVSAELVIGGTVMETVKFLQIFARVIDTETSEVMVTTDVYGEEVDMEVFEYLIGGLAWKIMKNFPMIEGTVVKLDDKDIYLDCGKDKFVKKNMRFIIYRPIDAETGGEAHDGVVEMLREVKVSKVDQNVSRSKVVRELEDKPIHVSDLVISK